MTPAFLTLALLALLWLLGIGVESIWDQRRYGRLSDVLKAESACDRFFRHRRP